MTPVRVAINALREINRRDLARHLSREPTTGLPCVWPHDVPDDPADMEILSRACDLAEEYASR